MTVLEYILLIAGVIVSGAIVLFIRIKPKALKLLLAFSGAFLFSISIMHLLPEIYEAGAGQAGLFILAGFLIQIIIEFFSEGIEHGHIHHHHHHERAFPATIMLALSIHSFLEGMPLAGNFVAHDHVHHSLLSGIILHNIPISIALVSMLRESGIRRSGILFWLVVFALMTPLGALVAGLMGESMRFSPGVYYNLMALVTGIFLHISTTILFESSENHRFNFIKLLVIIAGASAGVLY